MEKRDLREEDARQSDGVEAQPLSAGSGVRDESSPMEGQARPRATGIDMVPRDGSEDQV